MAMSGLRLWHLTGPKPSGVHCLQAPLLLQVPSPPSSPLYLPASQPTLDINISSCPPLLVVFLTEVFPFRHYTTNHLETRTLEIGARMTGGKRCN